jgi:hypothetical protein
VPYAGVPDRYYVAYFGAAQPRFHNVKLAYGQNYHVDLVDTWNMTVTRLEGIYGGTFRIELPGQPYMALRMVRADV